MDIKLQDSLAESLRWRCKESADDIAIKFLDRQQTYAQLDSNANRVAQGLLSFQIKPDSEQKAETNAAKVFYTLSKQNVPILDLQLRYKGDFKAQPQFFATITKEFKQQMFKECKVKKKSKKQNEITILNKRKTAK